MMMAMMVMMVKEDMKGIEEDDHVTTWIVKEVGGS